MEEYKHLLRYYNPIHGLELEADINLRDRGNDNCILFLVEYILLAQYYSDTEISSYHYRMFNNVVDCITVEPGLYDRGALDEMHPPKRTISHDNISAIASGSYLCGTKHAKDIAIYGLKHLFVYNNNQRGFRAPMNPGNYSIWLALGKTAPLLQLLFIPFYLANFFITNNKPKEATSGKLLNFVELYPLRKHWFWGKIYKIFINKMKKQYGDAPLKDLTRIY